MRKLIDAFMYILTGLAHVSVLIVFVLAVILVYCAQQ